MCYCPTPTLHLNLALTGDGAFLFSLKKTHSLWFISVLNYGDTENVLINHLLLVILCHTHVIQICVLINHINMPTQAHTHTHTASDLRVSDASWCHHRDTKSLSRTFSFTIPGWWNELPTPIRNAESLTIFKRHLKTHLFRHHFNLS